MLVFLPVLSFKSVYGMKFDKKCNYEPVFSILSSWLATSWLPASNPWLVSPCGTKCSWVRHLTWTVYLLMMVYHPLPSFFARQKSTFFH